MYLRTLSGRLGRLIVATALLTLLALAGTAGAARAAAFTVYLDSPFDSTSVIPMSTETNTPGSPIPVPGTTHGVAITPDGKTAYVATDAGLVPIAVATNTPGTPIAIPGGEDDVVLSPDGATADVANDDATGSWITPVSTATNMIGTPIRTPVPAWGLASTPDGRTIYESTSGNGTVIPVSTVTNTAGPPIPVPPSPGGMAVSPDGATLYANNGSDSVTPIPTATNKPGMPIIVGSPPKGIAITPDGKAAYVALYTTHVVVPITLATRMVGRPIDVGGPPQFVAITADGKTAYVTTLNGVTPIDVATNTAGAPIPLAGGANWLAITPRAVRQTTTTVSCSPQSVMVGHATTCTATVTDTDVSGMSSTPSGTVSFTTTGTGTFAGSPCTLTGSTGMASCQVTYSPATVGSGTHALVASYGGDAEHAISSGQSAVTVTAGPPVCDAGALRLDKVGGRHLAGQVRWDFALRNLGTRSCHIKGFPSVTRLNASAAALPGSAGHRGAVRPAVLLSPWGRAFFSYVYASSGCAPPHQTFYGLRVTPPGSHAALVWYAGRRQACSPDTGQVTAVTARP